MPLTPVPVSGSGLARLPRRGFWSFLPYSWSQLECGAQSLQGHEIQAGQPKVFQVSLVPPKGQNGPAGGEKRSQGWSAGVESKADREWQDLQLGSGVVVWSNGKV